MSREPISKPECRDRPVCSAGASVGPPAKWVLHRVRWPTESNHYRCHFSSKGHHFGLAVIAKQTALLPGVLAELTAYPLVWNGLPLALWSLPRIFSQKFLQQLKTILFGRTGVGSASE